MPRLEPVLAEAGAAERTAAAPAPTATPRPSRLRRAWSAAWPRLAAVAIVLIAWQAVVVSGWRPATVLPGPEAVGGRLWEDLANGDLPRAAGVTLRRALAGYAIALACGGGAGLLLARVRPLRTATGSLLTGLQSLPSVTWFPFALLLFGASEAAVLFVVIFGAAPSIAGGILAGIDQVPPQLLRAGHVLDARGLKLYRHVLIPAALPGVVAGMKQGWAFAWRSLMAGELLVAVAAHPSLGAQLQRAREASDAEGLLAAMVVVLAIGIAVDALGFGPLEQSIRRRRGLVEPAA